MFPSHDRSGGDNVWYWIGRRLKILNYDQDVIYEHNNYFLDRGDNDQVFEDINNVNVLSKDYKIYTNWLKYHINQDLKKIKDRLLSNQLVLVWEFIMKNSPSGSIRLASDSSVGTAGVPIRVFSANFISSGVADNFVLRNGTTDSGDIYVQQEAPVGVTATQSWHGGLLFPDGCFFDRGATIAGVIIEYREEVS